MIYRKRDDVCRENHPFFHPWRVFGDYLLESLSVLCNVNGFDEAVELLSKSGAIQKFAYV